MSTPACSLARWSSFPADSARARRQHRQGQSLRADRAQVRPVVAEVEHVNELLAPAQPRQPHLPLVLGDHALDLPVRIIEPGLVGEGELLQV